eukprot:TRINITY_DN77815_c0_g1_i1.p1 TRINITY_DN77815_c0_g1~~TRINITY_DN77815_c0_g1_i1.p1  ORF type:complete len:654 (+),score=136.59 TRINITY_DN77815_c0_g1_i1:34-1962(+)
MASSDAVEVDVVVVENDTVELHLEQPMLAKQPLLPLEASGHSNDIEALETILTHRNAELLEQIKQQQDVFLKSLKDELHLGNSMPKDSMDYSHLRSDLQNAIERTSRRPSVNSQGLSSVIEEDLDAASRRKKDRKGSAKSMESSMKRTGTRMDLSSFQTVEEVLIARGLTSEASNSSGGKRLYKNAAIDENGDEYEKAKKVSQQNAERRASVRAEEDEGESRGLSLPPWRALAVKIAASVKFQVLFTIAIVTNCILIGVQVEYTAVVQDEPTPYAFFVLNVVYTILFTIELVVNLAAQGCRMFWYTSDWYWHCLDLFIVIFSLTEIAIDVMIQSSDVGSMSTGQLRIIRVLRIARMARVAKIMRVVKALRSLRTLCYSIMCTLKSLAWALVLVGLIVYVFAILFTDAVVSHLAENPGPWDVDSSEFLLNRYFGTLHRSMHCLFRCMSGGITWNEAAEALSTISWLWVYMFTAFISFCCFAVLNVMTGVFCQSALESAQRDQEIAVQNVMLNRQRFEDMLMDLFQQIDEDGSGRITISEFEDHFQDEAVRCLLHSLELEVGDAWTLFMMLDQDGDHDIDAEEFLDGCMHLKGNAKAIEVAKLKRRTENSFTLITTKLQNLESSQLQSMKMLAKLCDRQPQTEF